jgi:dimethylaniline monooxygenase (N-oxide forming)
MRDLGLNPYRKSNIFEEWFIRYKPSDYCSILDEYRDVRRRDLENTK